MGVKILLADDSPTVHKVIKIILKDEPCEIVECSREAELADKLSQQQPSIVFLDFNFSESKTGYDLCREIKTKNPSTKILVMYGTFDTVDESLLREVGADQHVVKPFDTAKFIVQVRNLADGMSKAPAPASDKPSSAPIEEGWSIRETVERKTPDIGHLTNETVSSLSDDLNDWGMLIPGVIGKTSGAPDLPPVIGEEQPVIEKSAPAVTPAATNSPVAPQGGSHLLPSDEDLEYPDFGSSSVSLELEVTPTPVAEPKSKLVSLNELSPLEMESPLGSSQLLELSGMEDEGVKHIEDQIRDEVEADLWTVDAFEETAPKLSVVKEQPIQDEPEFTAHSNDFAQINDGGNAFDDNLFEPLDKQDKMPTYDSKPPQSNVALPADLNSLRPLIEQLVKQAVAEYCRQSVDKVAWEVIPDLAENLIKNELRKLSDKVSRDL